MYAVIDRENKEVLDVFVSKDSQEAEAYFTDSFAFDDYFKYDVIQIAKLLPEQERLSVFLRKEDFSEEELIDLVE